MTKPDKAHKIERITAVLDASPVALSATSIAEIIREQWCLTDEGEPYGEKVTAVLKTMPDAVKIDQWRGLWTMRHKLMPLPRPGLEFSEADNKRRIFERQMRNFAPD